MRRAFTRAVVFLGIAAFRTTAQEAVAIRADFSGKWAIEAPAGAAGQAQGTAPPSLSALGDMGSGWPAEIAIAQDGSTLTIDLAYFQPRDVQPTVRLTYALDGRESRNEINLGRGPQAQIGRVTFRGSSLVISTTHTFVHPRDGKAIPVEVTQTLTLTGPDAMSVETLRAGVLGGKSSTTRTVYRKRG